METKVCNHCGRELPLDNFYKKKDSPDGLQGTCKDCHRESARKSYAKRKTEKSTVDKVVSEGGLYNFGCQGTGSIPVIPTTNRFINLKTTPMKKEPTHRCPKCGRMKYKFEFHQGTTICKECRHVHYLKNRRRIIRKSMLYERLRCRRDKKYAEEREIRRRVFCTRRCYYRVNSFLDEIELFLFNINNVL